MKLVLLPRAEKQLRKLSKVDQIAVAKKIREIGKEEMLIVGTKLRGVGGFRIRVGDYRIVYRKTRGVTYIVLIGHRKEVYKMVRRLFG